MNGCSVLLRIQVTVLDKSKADWSVHRQEAALDKDLMDHNRSNDRYVDKQVQLALHFAQLRSRPMVLILKYTSLHAFLSRCKIALHTQKNVCSILNVQQLESGAGSQ